MYTTYDCKKLEDELFNNMFVKLSFQREQVGVSEFFCTKIRQPICIKVLFQTDEVNHFIDQLPKEWNGLPIEYGAVDQITLFMSYKVIINSMNGMTEEEKVFNVIMRY
jgi:hypothetical protein